MTINLASLITAPTAAADAGYRAVASIVSIAAIAALALGEWSSPLAALASLPLPDALAPALAWVPAAATWTAAHPPLIGGAGFVLLLVGLTVAAHEPVVALPADSRAGSTAALGFAALAQVDQLIQAGFALAACAAVVWVLRGVRGRGVDAAELFGAASVHLLGAVLALPLALVGFGIGSGPAEAPTADDAASL